jgi:ubiquinone/menaquinone biosynthesis C-methylase UbiE
MKDHNEQVKRFHDGESACYISERYNDKTCEGLAYMTRRSILSEMIKAMPMGRFLDIGCGPGVLTSELLNGRRDVVSVDLSLAMLGKASESIHDSPYRGDARFASCEASQLCFADGSFDVVLCIGVVYYVENYVAVMQEIYRILKETGVAVVQINKIASPAVYMTLVPAYRWLKTKLIGKSYEKMQFTGNVFSWQGFLSDMEGIGYEVERAEFYDFRVPFVDIVLPRFSVRLGKWLARHRESKMVRCLSQGVLICLRK